MAVHVGSAMLRRHAYDLLIPFRFLITIGHLVATFLMRDFAVYAVEAELLLEMPADGLLGGPGGKHFPALILVVIAYGMTHVGMSSSL